jgi:short-subunit dehydrogenase
MANEIKGTALVTGASSGIGAVYAHRLAHRGHDLILVARDGARMEGIAARLRAQTGRTVEVLPADLTNRAELAKIEARLASDAAIAVLVNNAGMSLKGGLLDNEPTEIEKIIALNITAPTLLAAAAGKAFVGRKAGIIINIASVLALAPELFDGVYSGSKAYLLNLTLKLAVDLQDAGVRVQAVLPGATRTEIWQRSGKDVDALMPGLVMEAGDLVDAALVGLDKGEVVTIPPLADERQWTDYNDARLAMAPNLSRRDIAERYRRTEAA